MIYTFSQQNALPVQNFPLVTPRDFARVFGAILALAGILCVAETRAQQTPAEFWKHWSDGKAEISAYSGTQSRYGETRASQNALIFVTEPFNAEKQVKADAPEPNNPMYPNVLKLNRVKRFQTGIYAYSIMTSVFTPLVPARARGASFGVGAPLKIAFSAQEWCGMTFHQLNRQADKTMLSQSNSYFEAESDRRETLKADEATLFGDDIFIAARELIKPLQPGSYTYYPTLEHARVNHQALAPTQITVAKQRARRANPLSGGAQTDVVEWTFSGKNFRWTLAVEQSYPRRILAFQYDENGKTVEKAEIKGSERLPYWRLNANGDESYLRSLGIQP